MRESTDRSAATAAASKLLDRATSGPAALLVDGEAGIGKTTLLHHTAELAASRGFTVLAASGSPSEVPCAFAAVADLLAAVDGDTVAALSPRQRIAMGRIRFGDDTDEPATDERMAASAFATVIEVLVARAPVLIAVDDVQWLDASSRVAIGFTARRLTGRVALLLTRRTGDADHGVGAPETVLPHPEILTRIRMKPMSADDVHAVIADRVGRTLARPALDRIHRLSGGNPMLALELARAEKPGTPGGSSLPADLTALVRRRLGHLDDDARRVLLTVACAGAPTAAVVEHAGGLPPDRVLATIESLEALDVVRLDGHRVVFTHPLFSAGVRADATPAERRAVHGALADVAIDPESRARHLALSSESGDTATLDALDAATDVLVARGALAAAAELVDLAVGRDGDTAARRIRAAELHFRSGAVPAARAHLHRAHLHRALDGLPRGPVRAIALAHLGAVKAYDDDLDGAIDAMTEAADDAGDAPAVHLMCLIRLALAVAVADRLDDACRYARRAAALAEDLNAPALRSQALSLYVLATFLVTGDVDHDELRTAVALEDPRSGATSFLRARAVEAVLSAYLGDLAVAETRMRAVRADMLAENTESDLVWADNRLTTIAVWSGRYAEADGIARAAVRRAEQLGARFSLATARTRSAAAAAYLGREADARADAHAAIEAARAVGAHRQANEPARVLGFLEVSLGDHAAALEVLQPLLDGFDPPRDLEVEGGGHLPDAVEALVAQDRLELAETLVEALETHGARRDRPWMLAVGARGRAAVCAARGDLDGAARALEHAVAQHHRMQMPFELARTRLLLGDVQRRRRQRGAAADTLTEALAVFERLGSPLWAQRARTALARLTVGDGGLTTAERRCADLAAAGRSNREIAEDLFLAEKTVEGTLSGVYRKLGVRRRAGLRSALATFDGSGDGCVR